MSGSVYNEGAPFNPALFLYLQPDIQTRENITTVEQAVQYYEDKKDDPAFESERETWLWSLQLIPESFDPSTYIVTNRLSLNVSEMEHFIRQAMVLDGLTNEEIETQSTFVVSVGKIAVLTADNTFTFDAEDNEIEITPRLFNVDDTLRIKSKNGGVTHTVKVAQITDEKTFIVSALGSSSISLTYLDNEPQEFEIIGINVADVERLAKINYVRHWIKNGEPPEDVSLRDIAFNPEFYRLLYPQTSSLNDEEAFVHYQKRKREDEYVIGSKQDLIHIILNNNTDGIRNHILFDRMTITDRLDLAFSTDKQTGFFRFIDKDIYYVTSDSERTSDNLSTTFEGFITERAIKKYVENLSRNPEFENITVLTNATFCNTTFEGNVNLKGKSNVIKNVSLENADLRNITLSGSQAVVSTAPLRFENEAVFNENVTFAQPLLLNNPLLTSNTVTFYDTVEAKGNMRFTGDPVFEKNALFSGQTIFDGPVEISCNIHVTGTLVVDALDTQFNEDVRFEKTAHILNELKAHDRAVFMPESITHFEGDVNMTGCNIIIGYEFGKEFEQEGKSNGTKFILNTPPQFNTSLTFENPIQAQGVAVFEGPVTLSNNTEVFGITDFYERTIFNSNVEFEGEISADTLVVHSNATFLNTASFEGPETRIEGELNVLGQAHFENNVTISSHLSLKDKVDVNDTSVFTFNTANVKYNQGFQAKGDVSYLTESAVDFHGSVYVNSNLSLSGLTEVTGDLKVDTKNPTLFKSPVDFDADVVMHDPLRLNDVVEAHSNSFFYGPVQFGIKHQIEPSQIEHDSIVTMNMPVKMLKDVEVRDKMVFTDSDFKLSSNNEISTLLETRSDANAAFFGPVTFSNVVDVYHPLVMHDTPVQGSAFFEDTITFTSNVIANHLLKAQELTVEEAAHFKGRVDYACNVTYEDEVVYTDDVLYEGEVRVKGPLIGLGAIFSEGEHTFKGEAYHQAPAFFKAPVFFENESIFEEETRFNRDVQHKAHVTFEKSTTFLGATDLENKVRFHDEVTFDEKLGLEDARIERLEVPDLKSAQNAFSNMTVAQTCGFLPSSKITGQVTFKEGKVVMDEEARFLQETRFEDDVFLKHYTRVTEALDVATHTTTFTEGNVHFNNDAVFVHTPFYFEATPSFSNGALFEGEARFKEELVAEDDARFNKRAVIDEKAELIVKGDLLTLPQAHTCLKGDVQFEADAYFQSNVFMKQDVIIEQKLNTLPGALTAFEGQQTFDGDTTFLSGQVTFCNGVDVTYYTPVTFSNNTFLHSDHTHITQAFIDEADITNAYLSGQGVFTENSVVTFKGDVIIDTPYFSVPQQAHFGDLRTSNLTSKHSLMQGSNIFVDYLETQGETLIKHQFVTAPEAQVQFLSPVHLMNDVYQDAQSTFFVPRIELEKANASNMTVNVLRIDSNLDIDRIDVDDLSTKKALHEDAHIVKGYSEEHTFDKLNAQNVGISNLYVVESKHRHLAVEDAYHSNLYAERSEIYEQDVRFLNSSNAVLQDLRAGYARLLKTSNDDAYFVKQKTEDLEVRNLKARNLDVEVLKTKFEEARSFEAIEFKALDATIDTLACKSRGEFNETFGMSNFVRHLGASNAYLKKANMDDVKLKNVELEKGQADKLYVTLLDSLHHSNISQVSEDIHTDRLTSQRITTNEAIITEGYVSSLSNTFFESEKIKVKEVESETLKNEKALVNLGPAAFTGKCSFCNDVEFLKETEFKNPVTFGGDVLVNGQNNKIHNLEIQNAQINGAIQFNSTAFMNESVVVRGAYFGSRIGLGPYKKSMGIGDRTDMANVAFLNTRTGTKVFAQKAPLGTVGNSQIGLDGGDCVLEASRFPNAIVQLDGGMQQLVLRLSPMTFPSEMIGITGKITYIERSIYGRNLKWFPDFVFSHAVKQESDKEDSDSDSDNDLDDYVIRTTPAPDSRGGYAVDVVHYTILGPELITATYTRASTVAGSMIEKDEDTWQKSITNTSLYIGQLNTLLCSQNENDMFLTVYQRLTNTFENFAIDFSNDLTLDSDLMMTFIVLYEAASGLPQRIMKLNERLTQTKNKIPIVLDGQQRSNISWAVLHKQDEDGSLIEIIMTNGDGAEEIIPSPILTEQERQKETHVTTLAHHGQGSEGAFNPSWYRTFCNANIKALCVFDDRSTCVVAHRVKNETKTEEVFFGAFDEDREPVFKVQLPDFDGDEVYAKSDLARIDDTGALIWSIPFLEKIERVESTTRNNIALVGHRIPHKAFIFRDAGSEKIEALKLGDDYEAQNVFLVFLNKRGDCFWTALCASLAKQTFNALAVMGNQDIICGFYMNMPQTIYLYNSVNIVGVQKNPLDKSNVLPNSSWDDYQVLSKFNSLGYAQWMLFASCVEDKVIIKTYKEPCPNAMDGFIAVFMPKAIAQKDVAEMVMFNAFDAIQYNGTFLMEQQRTGEKNEEQLRYSCAVIAHYSNRGKINWVVTMRSIDVDAQNRYTSRFDRMDVALLQSGGFVVGFGNMLENDDRDDISRDIEIKDSKGNERIVSALNQIRFSSGGSFSS